MSGRHAGSSADRRGDAGDTGVPGGRASPAGLPPLFTAGRRRYLVLLVLAGLGQAAAGGTSALALRRAFHGSGTGYLLPVVLLGLVAVTVGLLRMAERILAEQLSQDYVHEVRSALVRASLAQQETPSLGVTVARTTNDLTSVRNWIALGVAPLASGSALVLGATVALAALDPALAVAAAVPLLALGAALLALAPPAYHRSRRVRRRRGRLAGQIADTALAARTVRAGGGEERELRRIERHSRDLVEASIARARVAGALRGSAAAAAGAATATVVAVGLGSHVPLGTVAGALTIIGILATPVHDLGRVVEYRQSYRAARRIVVRVLTGADPAPGATRRSGGEAEQAAPATSQVEPASRQLQVRGLRTPQGVEMPELDVHGPARVALVGGDRASTAWVVEALAGLRTAPGALVLVDGHDVATLPPRSRRRLVGMAAQGMPLERGTLARALRYRVPDAPDDVSELLAAFGLDPCVARLPDGERTDLRHGGEPLSVPERARVLLARSMLGAPPLLLLDHLEADLDAEGRRLMRERLAGYPGIVVIASEDPSSLVEVDRSWGPLDTRVRRSASAGPA